MMSKHIIFYQLEQVLNQLGFEEILVKGSHVAFKNSRADAIIVLPDIQKDREVKFAHLRMVEKVLDEKGILSRDKFEDLFDEFLMVNA